MGTKFEPLGDRILVRRDSDEEKKTAGGIIIPSVAQEKPVMGTVEEVGPGSLREDGTRTEMPLVKGDRVVFGRYSGVEVKIDDDCCLIMHIKDVFGRVGAE